MYICKYISYFTVSPPYPKFPDLQIHRLILVVCIEYEQAFFLLLFNKIDDYIHSICIVFGIETKLEILDFKEMCVGLVTSTDLGV